MKIAHLLIMLISFQAIAAGKKPTAQSIAMAKEKATINKLYRNIQRDIKLVKKKARHSTRFKVRLFELYVERFNYLRKKENAIFIESKNINVVKRKKKALRKILMGQLREIETLAKTLERSRARFARKELGRVMVILAEISRDLNIESKHVYYLTKANKYVYRKKYRNQVDVFLAEHYYNNKKYKTALKYYRRVLKDKDSYWYSKHLYNASWCYLKLDNFNMAIKLITLAHKTSRTTKYVNLGPQALDHLSLFYAMSGRTKTALQLLPRLTGDPYSILIRFSNDTVRFGNKKHIEAIFSTVERYVTLPTKRLEFLLHKIQIYRKLTRYDDLQRAIYDVARVHKKIKKVPEDTSSELVSEIKSYTGLLQERFIKGNISPKKKDIALSRIMKNFDILSLLNPAQRYEYLYFQGETLYGYKKFPTAINYYQQSIVHIEKTRKKEKDSKALIEKRLNAIFSGLEQMDTNIKLKEASYEYAYQKYLEHFPKTAKAQSMYQKLFTLYFKKAKHDDAIKTITRYNQNFPKDQKFQKSMYDDIMRFYIKKKDAPRLTQLIEKPKKGYLGYTKKDVLKFQEILYQIYFTVYNKQLAQKDFDASIKGFSELFVNEKVPYSVRYRAGLKALEIFTKNFKRSINELSSWTVKLMDYGKKEDFLADRSRFEFIVQLLSTNGHLKDSYELISKYRAKARFHKLSNAKIKPIIETELLLALALEERKDVLKTFDDYRRVEKSKDFRVAYNKQVLNHFVMTGKDEYTLGYIKRYKDVAEFSSDFDYIITNLAWKEYDREGKSSTIASFIKKELSPQFYKRSYSYLREEADLNRLKQVKFVSFKKGPVTFESFTQEIEQVIGSLQVQTAAFDTFIKNAESKAVIRTVKVASEEIGRLAVSISQYTPETPEKELKKAILIETKKLEQIVLTKKQEYLKLIDNINSNVALFDPALFDLKKEKTIKDFFAKPVDMKLFSNTLNEVNQ